MRIRGHKFHLHVLVFLGIYSPPEDVIEKWGNPELAIIYLICFLAVILMPYAANGERTRLLIGRCVKLTLWVPSSLVVYGLALQTRIFFVPLLFARVRSEAESETLTVFFDESGVVEYHAYRRDAAGPGGSD